MKLTVERDHLVKMLSVCVSIADKKMTIPILCNIKLEANGSKLLMMTHNLDACIETSIPADVQDEGACSVPCALLNKLIKSLPAGSHLKLVLGPSTLSLSSNSAEYNLPTLPASDIPEPFRPQEPHTINLDEKLAAYIFGRPIPAMSSETTRYYLCGIYLHNRDGLVSGVASDGRHMVFVKSAIPFPADAPEIIVPSYAVHEIVKLVEGEARLSWSSNVISLDTGEIRFSSRLINGTFPDYERVLPGPSDRVLEFDSADLVAVVERAGFGGRTEIEIAWDDNPTEATIVITGEMAGTERIACTATEIKSGSIFFTTFWLREALGLVVGARVGFKIPESDEGFSGPIDLVDASDETVRLTTMRLTGRTVGREAA